MPKLTTRASWREKIERAAPAKVVDIPPRMQRQHGTGTLLIPHPRDVEAHVRRIPAGALLTIGQLRAALARDAGATIACPLVTGIFLRLIAEAAEDARAAGDPDLTPYWRVITDNGCLRDRLPGGAEHQAELLRAEGHEIEMSGKTLGVRDFRGKVVV